MKKSLKIAIATVLILLVGTAGVLYYFLNVKEYDVADKKVEEITKNDYKVDLPSLDSIEDGSSTESGSAGEDGTDTEDAGGDAGSDSEAATANASGSSSSSDSSSNSSSGEKSSTSTVNNDSSTKKAEGNKKDSSTNKQEDKKPAITAEMIKAAYRPSFEELEAQANAKVDALVGAAYSEYSTKKQNGESVSVTYFYRKYTSAGEALEANTDETFNYIYGSLVNDLTARGFSKSEAAEFKTQYENSKEARETALLEKAKAAL